MAEAYSSFASVYDSFMDDIPYEEWAAFIREQIKKYGVKSRLVCDLGCGTGKLTALLRDQGFDMIGVDLSAEMLDIAREDGEGILYLCQDMREFELFGTVGTIVSACDCVNYVADPEELKKVFRLVNNYLESRGLYIFDFHTKYYYEEVLGCNNFADNRDNASIIWENWYDDETRINEYNITIYSQLKNGDYRRFEETHVQRAYTAEEITELLKEAGLELLAMHDSYSAEAPTAESERITVIARECFQPGKHYE